MLNPHAIVVLYVWFSILQHVTAPPTRSDSHLLSDLGLESSSALIDPSLIAAHQLLHQQNTIDNAIEYAVAENYSSACIEHLIVNGIPSQQQENKWQFVLSLSVMWNRADIVHFVIERRFISQLNYGPLMLAVLYQRNNMVRYFLQKGVSPQVLDPVPPLLLAIVTNQEDVVATFLQHAAVISYPILEISKRVQPELFKKLWHHYYIPYNLANSGWQMPVYDEFLVACATGNSHYTYFKMQQNAFNPLFVSQQNLGCLRLAIINRDHATITMLLAHGSYHETLFQAMPISPILLAIALGDEKTVHMLLNTGMPVHAHHVRLANDLPNRNDNIVRLIYDRVREFNHGILLRAIKSGDLKQVESMLLDTSEKTTAASNTGSGWRYKDILKLDIHRNRNEAVRVASLSNQIEIVKSLIRHGANVNDHSDDDQPILIEVALKGMNQMVKVLVRYGGATVTPELAGLFYFRGEEELAAWLNSQVEEQGKTEDVEDQQSGILGKDDACDFSDSESKDSCLRRLKSMLDFEQFLDNEKFVNDINLEDI